MRKLLIAMLTLSSLSHADEKRLKACDLALKSCGEVVEAQDVQVRELSSQNEKLRKSLADVGSSSPWYFDFLLGVLVGGITYSLLD